MTKDLDGKDRQRLPADLDGTLQPVFGPHPEGLLAGQLANRSFLTPTQLRQDSAKRRVYDDHK